MTNEKWVNAPISKIVEAIRKKDLEVYVETFGEVNGDNINHFILSEEDLIEALASLGGEDNHPSEREVLERFTKWHDTKYKPSIFRMVDRYLAEKSKTEKK